MKVKRVKIKIDTNGMGKDVWIIMNKQFHKHLSLFKLKILHNQPKAAPQNSLFFWEKKSNL